MLVNFLPVCFASNFFVYSVYAFTGCAASAKLFVALNRNAVPPILGTANHNAAVVKPFILFCDCNISFEIGVDDIAPVGSPLPIAPPPD